MKEVDGFIFGTPVHYAGATGNMTAFMDRVFYSTACGGHSDYYMYKPAAMVVSARRAGTKDLMVESDYLGIVSANNVSDKFEKSGLHSTKSEKVDAPIIDEYPICMECKVVGFEEDGTLIEK